MRLTSQNWNRNFQVSQIEFLELSKKKPDGPLNKFKLQRVNQLLELANTYFESNDRPFQDFTIFSDDQLPTNSDVRMILSQYRMARP